MLRFRAVLVSVLAAASIAAAPIALAKGNANGKSCRSSSRSKGSRSASGKHATAHVASHARSSLLGSRVSGHGMRRTKIDSSLEAIAASPNTCPTCERDETGRMRVLTQSESDFMRETGYPYGRAGHALGYIVPLRCGGADDPKNMQWLTIEATAASAKAPCAQ